MRSEVPIRHNGVHPRAMGAPTMPAVMDVRTLGSTWASVAAGFRWDIPERYNIAADTVDRQPGH